MKTLLILALLLAGCMATADPFRTYVDDAGVRTWSLEIRDAWRKHLAEKTDEEILARAHGHAGFCTNGYQVERREPFDGGIVYHGSCD